MRKEFWNALFIACATWTFVVCLGILEDAAVNLLITKISLCVTAVPAAGVLITTFIRKR